MTSDVQSMNSDSVKRNLDSALNGKNRDFLLKVNKNVPEEFKKLKCKFIAEVQRDINNIWYSRKKAIMDVELLNSWYPSNWKNMSAQQLHSHFLENFCTESRLIKDRARAFEQLAKGKAFKDKIKNEYAREFNNLTLKVSNKLIFRDQFGS